MGSRRDYPERPLVGAGAVIVRGDQVVLVRRGRPPLAGEWSIPGGAVKLGETLRQAAEREAREETGLSGTIVGKIDTIKYSYTAKWEKPSVRVFKIVTFYLLKYTEGDPSQHDREVDRVEWFPIERAISSATYPQEKTILRKAKELIARSAEDPA